MKKLIIIFLIGVIAIGGGFYLYVLSNQSTNQQENENEEIITEGEDDSDIAIDDDSSNTQEPDNDDGCPTGLVCLGSGDVPKLPTLKLGVQEVYAADSGNDVSQTDGGDETNDGDTNDNDGNESNENDDQDSGASDSDTSSIQNRFMITNKDYRIWSIFWVTEQAEIGYVQYGTSPENMERVELDARDTGGVKEKRYTHYVDFENPSSDLENENLVYYFHIVSGDTVYDNNGVPFEYENAPLTSSPSVPTSITVSTEKVSGYSTDDYVVIVKLENSFGDVSQPVSEVFNGEVGVDVITGIARENDLQDYFSQSNTNKLDVSVYGPDGYTGNVKGINSADLEDKILEVELRQRGYGDDLTVQDVDQTGYNIDDRSDDQDYPITDDDLPETGIEDSAIFTSVFGFVILLLGICVALIIIPWNYRRIWEKKVLCEVE